MISTKPNLHGETLIEDHRAAGLSVEGLRDVQDGGKLKRLELGRGK
jgi:hypothetical protein